MPSPRPRSVMGPRLKHSPCGSKEQALSHHQPPLQSCPSIPLPTPPLPGGLPDLCSLRGPGAQAAWPRTSGVMEPQSWLMRASWCCSVLPCMIGLRVHISAMMHPAPHRSMGGP